MTIVFAIMCFRLSAYQNRNDISSEWFSLFCEADFLYNDGAYEEAMEVAKKALALVEAAPFFKDPLLAEIRQSLESLAKIHRAMGKYSEAESLYMQALDVVKQDVGRSDDHFMTTSLLGLAELCKVQGKYATSESLYNQVLDIIRHMEMQIIDHTDIVISLNGLAEICRTQGKFDRALIFYKRAFDTGKEDERVEHSHIMFSLNGLAEVLKLQGQYSKAESIYKCLLAEDEYSFDSENPNIITVLDNLAEIYAKQGKYISAESVWVVALTTCENFLGLDHPDIVISLDGLSNYLDMYPSSSFAESIQQRVEYLLLIQACLTGDTGIFENAIRSGISLGGYDPAAKILMSILLAFTERSIRVNPGFNADLVGKPESKLYQYFASFQLLLKAGADPKAMEIIDFEKPGIKELQPGVSVVSTGKPGHIVPAGQGGMSALEFCEFNYLVIFKKELMNAEMNH
jgi:tetratricopeptide (TPR) repeat protein